MIEAVNRYLTWFASNYLVLVTPTLVIAFLSVFICLLILFWFIVPHILARHAPFILINGKHKFSIILKSVLLDNVVIGKNIDWDDLCLNLKKDEILAVPPNQANNFFSSQILLLKFGNKIRLFWCRFRQRKLFFLSQYIVYMVEDKNQETWKVSNDSPLVITDLKGGVLFDSESISMAFDSFFERLIGDIDEKKIQLELNKNALLPFKEIGCERIWNVKKIDFGVSSFFAWHGFETSAVRDWVENTGFPMRLECYGQQLISNSVLEKTMKNRLKLINDITWYKMKYSLPVEVAKIESQDRHICQALMLSKMVKELMGIQDINEKLWFYRLLRGFSYLNPVYLKAMVPWKKEPFDVQGETVDNHSGEYFSYTFSDKRFLVEIQLCFKLTSMLEQVIQNFFAFLDVLRSSKETPINTGSIKQYDLEKKQNIKLDSEKKQQIIMNNANLFCKAVDQSILMLKEKSLDEILINNLDEIKAFTILLTNEDAFKNAEKIDLVKVFKAVIHTQIDSIFNKKDLIVTWVSKHPFEIVSDRWYVANAVRMLTTKILPFMREFQEVKINSTGKTLTIQTSQKVSPERIDGKFKIEITFIKQVFKMSKVSVLFEADKLIFTKQEYMD